MDHPRGRPVTDNASVRDRLAEALRAMTIDDFMQGSAHVADVLLALPDIAVIELPEPSYVDEPEAGEKGYGFNGDQGDSRLASERGLYVHDGLVYDQYDSVTPADARKVASWWAAAAVVAERKEQP